MARGFPMKPTHDGSSSSQPTAPSSRVPTLLEATWFKLTCGGALACVGIEDFLELESRKSDQQQQSGIYNMWAAYKRSGTRIEAWKWV
ncbi:hypothetical protein SAY87_007875 [Trapa incisa]|uniref:Uncharacterized protein n=1 Tax=Trapa incisa TaxID=236973 RepID=A0AAN7QG27_9MYRT|nr:hypothetical protein SAY87_007875 [Trapa incisa]